MQSVKTPCDELSGMNLSEQSWLLLIYYTACLLHNHNFREVSEVQDRDKY